MEAGVRECAAVPGELAFLGTLTPVLLGVSWLLGELSTFLDAVTQWPQKATHEIKDGFWLSICQDSVHLGRVHTGGDHEADQAMEIPPLVCHHPFSYCSPSLGSQSLGVTPTSGWIFHLQLAFRGYTITDTPLYIP